MRTITLVLEGNEIHVLNNALIWQKFRKKSEIKSLQQLITEQPDRQDRAAVEQLLNNAQEELDALCRIHEKLRNY